MARFYSHLIALFTVFSSLQPLLAQFSDQETDSIYRRGLTFMEAYDFKEAAKCFYDCQREQHDNPVYHYALGQAYEQMGNIQDARLFYRKALSLDTLEVRYLMALGNIEMQRRDYQAARAYFESMILLDS